ncbi:MAG: hypothetical protein K8R44_01585, partial [Sulfurimonas sp.]|nr:hypothetical protein [Sulfurimonas sp.]
MLPINTVYLDNVGFKEAYFSDINLDFYNPSSSNKKSLDTLISLENTGGKSSMISFILTMFVPKKSRFVQHIQESNHKFEDYFYPSPGLILLKLELPEDKGKLRIDENNYLILGQYVTVSQNKTSRYFFSFDSTSSLKFEDVPSLSKEGKDFNEDSITKWLNEGHQNNSTFFHTDTHHKWVDKLNTMGIDTWLAEKQVEFCSAEGGIKEFVNFSSEADFLKEFFYMAIPEDTTEKIKISLKDTLQKLSKMPQNKEKVEHLNKLLDNLQNFKKESDKYTILVNSYEASQANIYMHCSALDEKKRGLSEEVSDLGEAIEDIKQGVTECQENIQNSEKYIESLTLQKYIYEIEEKSDNLEKKENALINQKVELGSCNVARPKLKVNSLSKKIEGLKESILKASEGLEPLREIMYQYAWEYTCKIKYLTKLEEKDQKELEKNNSALDVNIKKFTFELKGLKKNNKNLIENKSINKTLIESRQNALDKLIEDMYVESNESVENRLEINREALESVKGIIDTIGQDKKQKNKNKDLLSKKISDMRLDKQEQETNSRDVEKNIAKEEQDRFKILENMLIKQLNDYEKVEVISTTLLSKIKKQLEINVSDMKTNEILHSKIEEEILLLQKTGSKLIDAQVQKVLELLQIKGISSAKLFPHYLADIYKDDSEQIKNTIESNPGVFLGIAVNTLDELNKARLLSEEINFLSRPVVISLTSCINTLEDSESVVISVSSKKIYSQKELPAYIGELKKQADELLISIEENGNKIENIESLKRNLTEYFSSYGDGKIEQIKYDFKQLNIQLEELEISLNTEEEKEIKLQETIELLEEEEKKEESKKFNISTFISQLKTFYDQRDKNHETMRQIYQVFSNELDENIGLLDSAVIDLTTEGQNKINIEKKLDISMDTLKNLLQELDAITVTSDYVGKTIDEEELELNDKSSYKENYEDAQNILRREEN